MIKWKFIRLQVGEWILNKRWWVIALASLCVLSFEFVEYHPFQGDLQLSFFFEISFYGILLPISTGLALTWAAVTRTELAWSTYYLGLIQNLDIQLHKAHSHNELAAVFLQFLRVVMPVIGVTMYKYEQKDQNFKTVLNWSLQNIPLPKLEFACATDVCPFISVQDAGKDALTLGLCQDPSIVLSSRKTNFYCLPFQFSNSIVAGARLYFPNDNQLSPEQTRLMKEIAPAIAEAFHRIQLEHLMKKHEHGISAEQQRIARDVHDSLGHNLAYLRLRLDQLSMGFDQEQLNSIHHEVRVLRDVANEAYDQMRDVLTVLTLPNDANLSDTLSEYAQRIRQRGSLNLKIHHEGQPRLLSPVVHRNCFLIFKEILTNIENHARAQLVSVDLKWQETGFVIEICDDGIGFDPDTTIPDGHFGLKNIRERVLDISAQLDISSQAGQGTLMTFHIPYETES